ncbi:MAG: cell division ATP-binding protein FtsE [Burkholderiaceae bacterium]
MVEFRQVSKRYGRDGWALRDLSLTVAAGELVFLAGPSGAGKSTLLKLIAAVERPTSGMLLLNGEDIGRLPQAGLPYLRRRIGTVFQDRLLLDDRSVLANVMLPLEVTGVAAEEARQRSRAALERVGLLDKADARPQSLSGGQQQRVAVARAIVNRPRLILADEPTAHLDRDSAVRVLDALRSFHAAGVTCLISTHDEQFLNAATRVVFLDEGRVVDTWRGKPLPAAETA